MSKSVDILTCKFLLNSTKVDILIKDKGKFKFDKTKECISGNEYLWNATTRKRGSIVIIVEPSKIDFRSIFENCYRPGLSATPNTGNTLSATKKVRMKRKKIILIFASLHQMDLNGCKFMLHLN